MVFWLTILKVPTAAIVRVPVRVSERLSLECLPFLALGFAGIAPLDPTLTGSDFEPQGSRIRRLV